MVLHVACAADEAYVAHSAAMLHSVLAHSGDHHVHVHYLHGTEFPAKAAERLAGMVRRDGGEISFHEIAGERVAGLPADGLFSPAIWYRIFLPELVPGASRVLYLDADTIVTDALAPLWQLDLSGSYVGAVTNVFMHEHAHRPAELGLAPGAYFNSGVLLMNLDLMRRDGCSEALRRLALERSGELAWPDQDALNLVLGARRLALHPRWNAMNSVLAFDWAAEVLGEDAVREAREHPAIRHFEGPPVNKPWHFLCEREGRERYGAHRRRTPWPYFVPQGLTPHGVVKRLARL